MSRFRRGILARVLNATPSDWTYEWDISKGHLDVNGYTLSGVNGYGGGLSYTSEGAYLNVNNYQNVTIALNDLSSDVGILESTFNIEQLGNVGINFVISNGSDSCYVQFIYQDNDYRMGVQTSQYEFSYITGLENVINNVDCTLRIEFVADGTKKVYLNDTLVYSGETYKASNTNRIWIRYDNKILIKSIKWKL